MKTGKIWLITGVSGGLGRAIAIEVAKTGDIAIGTLRKEEQMEDFGNMIPGKTVPVLLDVTDYEKIPVVIAGLVAKFGRIDVLVNNAGYGLLGAIEEVSMAEARRQMETNFFGALAMTQVVLPFMRKQKSGAIVQVSSQAGMRGNSGLGLYNASKFALEGFNEALYLETKPLNIHTIIVEPGPFRTDWAGASIFRAEKVIDDYIPTAGTVINNIRNINGKQPGDPAKGAKAIIKAVNSEQPPLRLPLGEPALKAMREKLRSVEDNFNSWEAVSVDTAFD